MPHFTVWHPVQMFNCCRPVERDWWCIFEWLWQGPCWIYQCRSVHPECFDVSIIHYHWYDDIRTCLYSYLRWLGMVLLRLSLQHSDSLLHQYIYAAINTIFSLMLVYLHVGDDICAMFFQYVSYSYYWYYWYWYECTECTLYANFDAVSGLYWEKKMQ